MESRQARREASHADIQCEPKRLRTNGLGRLDQDQERNGPNSDFPSIMPRRNLRLLRHEHWRHQHFGLHQQDRWRQLGQARQNLSLASYVRCQRFGARYEQLLQPVRFYSASELLHYKLK